MSQARRKLMIARFHLDEMLDNATDFDSLTSYLDGFLSSARSVTLLLQTEFSSKKGFREWYETKIKSVDPENDFPLFNELRRTSVHVQNVYPNPSVTATDYIHYTDSYSARLYDKSGNLIKEVKGGSKTKEMPKVEKKIKHLWVFRERPHDDAPVLCERYYSKLREIVDECEQRFLTNV
jgi:hypothetical protein